jgi:dihydrofolate synthase/folylpolyglutamate synthase
MADKDIDGIIAHMKPHIDHWCVTDLPVPRAASAAEIAARLSEAGVDGGAGPDAEHSVLCFAAPAEAYANARSRAGENDRIAVFGSFLTVAGVISARKSEYH